MQAAAYLAATGVSTEFIDPHSLKPHDEGVILTSERKTVRVLVAH